MRRFYGLVKRPFFHAYAAARSAELRATWAAEELHAKTTVALFGQAAFRRRRRYRSATRVQVAWLGRKFRLMRQYVWVTTVLRLFGFFEGVLGAGLGGGGGGVRLFRFVALVSVCCCVGVCVTLVSVCCVGWYLCVLLRLCLC